MKMNYGKLSRKPRPNLFVRGKIIRTHLALFFWTWERTGTGMGRPVKESKTVCIRLEKNIYNQLIITSKKEGRTNTKIIEMALQDYFKKSKTENKFLQEKTHPEYSLADILNTLDQLKEKYPDEMEKILKSNERI